MALRILRIALEVLALLILLASILFLIVVWEPIPDRVPTNFGIGGEITGWSGKTSLLALPVINVILFAVLTVTNRVTFGTRRREIPPSGRIWLSALKLSITALFGAIMVFSALARPLPAWFLPASLAAALVPSTGLTVVSMRWERRRRGR